LPCEGYTSRMRIAVVGLGKIGQPLAALYASRGHQVVGADVNPAVVASIKAGRATVVNEPGLETLVADVVATGRLDASCDTAMAVSQAEVVLVAVPMLIDGQRQLDYHMIDAAFAEIARGLGRGTLVLLETTVPVGDTRNRFGACLERSGLRLGSDFCLAFSPERVQSGSIFRDLENYPKVVGGVDAGRAGSPVEQLRGGGVLQAGRGGLP
jgi:nucleotide sugar dehydrogenase